MQLKLHHQVNFIAPLWYCNKKVQQIKPSIVKSAPSVCPTLFPQRLLIEFVLGPTVTWNSLIWKRSWPDRYGINSNAADLLDEQSFCEFCRSVIIPAFTFWYTPPHHVTENENGDVRPLFIPNICLKGPTAVPLRVLSAALNATNSTITYISIYCT